MIKSCGLQIKYIEPDSEIFKDEAATHAKSMRYANINIIDFPRNSVRISGDTWTEECVLPVLEVPSLQWLISLAGVT